MQSMIRPVMVKSLIWCLVLGLLLTSVPAWALRAARIVNFTVFLRYDPYTGEALSESPIVEN